ncbi:hypothetical protein IWQ60_010966 [Tieghemiomyces parasiticus]|uniref:Oxysterol-binding protein n=1 Tax=Tieghemiomyces parasiticus TaxID=78921 RepID=A0A9W8DIZ2_9FUNG|nr:hypothetical protein IWQ60_010966 [Tieghemiomyces parasiticus]
MSNVAHSPENHEVAASEALGKLKLTDTDSAVLTDTPAVPYVQEGDEPAAGGQDIEKSRFAALWGILHKLVGVKDFVSMRISLPAELLDPVPNLEHWNYMERPDYFARLSDPEDPVDRMLGVAAWWFTKDLKYVHHKLKKPYNSILGEQFLCYWLVDDTAGAATNGVRSSAESSGSQVGSEVDVASTTVVDGAGPARRSDAGKRRVEYITEQVSHHPPISAYHYRCLEKDIHATGLDHICAKFTGTSIKVEPGERAKGLYLRLGQRDNEEYVLTHPTGNVTGFLRGQLAVQVSDSSVITCAKTGLALYISYKEERWFGKAKHAIEGKLFRYDPNSTKSPSPDRLKFTDIPKAQVLATLEGSWRGQIHVRRTTAATGRKSSDPQLLVDMESIQSLPKQVKPLESQGELESRKVWADVTTNILAGKFSAATKAKHAIEDRQRAKANEAKKVNREFQPEFFDFHPDDDCRPILKERSFNL